MTTRRSSCVLAVATLWLLLTGCAAMLEDRKILAIYQRLETQPRFNDGWLQVSARHDESKGTWSSEVSSILVAAFKLDVNEGLRILTRRGRATLEKHDLKAIYTYGYLRGELLKIAVHGWMFDNMLNVGCLGVLEPICGSRTQKSSVCADREKRVAACTKFNGLKSVRKLPPLYEPSDLDQIRQTEGESIDEDNEVRLAAFNIGLVHGFPEDFDLEAEKLVKQGFDIGCKKMLGAMKAFNVTPSANEQRAYCDDAWRTYNKQISDYCRQSEACKTTGKCRSAGFFCA